MSHMAFEKIRVFLVILWLYGVAQFLGDGTYFVEPGFLVIAVIVGLQIPSV